MPVGLCSNVSIPNNETKNRPQNDICAHLDRGDEINAIKKNKIRMKIYRHLEFQRECVNFISNHIRLGIQRNENDHSFILSLNFVNFLSKKQSFKMQTDADHYSMKV